MARCIYGSIVTNISGKVGGTVFQNNKYGFSVKNSPNMKKPNSLSVQSSQRLMVQATQGWRSLTELQRNQFNTYATSYPQYAKHNISAVLSGYAIFIRWWFILAECGYSVLNTPVMDAVTLPSIDPSLNYDGPDLNFILGNTVIEGQIAFAIFLSGNYQSSRNFPPINLRYIVNMQLDSEPATINSLYLAIFGVLPSVGQDIYCRVVPFGLQSPVVFAEQFFKLKVTAK